MPASLIGPQQVLARAIEAVPAIRFALAVAGIAAALTIIAGFRLGWLVSALGVVVMLGLMTATVIFAGLVDKGAPPSAIRFLAWAFVSLTAVVAALTVTTTFVGWPGTWSEIVGRTRAEYGGTILSRVSLVRLIDSGEVRLSDFHPRDLPDSPDSDSWRPLVATRICWLCKIENAPEDVSENRQKLDCSGYIADAYIGDLGLLAAVRRLAEGTLVVISGRLGMPKKQILAVPVRLDSIFVVQNWPTKPSVRRHSAGDDEMAKRKAAVASVVARVKVLSPSARATALLELPTSELQDFFELTDYRDFEAVVLSGLSYADLTRLLWKRISDIPIVQGDTTLKELSSDPNAFAEKEKNYLGPKEMAVVGKLRDIKNNPTNYPQIRRKK
jgi:hypothetical protein